MVLCLVQGGRKTKLGLREFVTLGEFKQNIDVKAAQAVSVPRPLLQALNSIRASYEYDHRGPAACSLNLIVEFTGILYQCLSTYIMTCASSKAHGTTLGIGAYAGEQSGFQCHWAWQLGWVPNNSSQVPSCVRETSQHQF